MASFFLREDPLLLFSTSSPRLCSLSNGLQWCFQSSDAREWERSDARTWDTCSFVTQVPFFFVLSEVLMFSLLIIRSLWNGISHCFGKTTFIGSQLAQEMAFCCRGYMNMTFKITGNILSTNSIRTHKFEVCLDSHRLRSHRTERWVSQDDAASTELEWTTWPRWEDATWWVHTIRLPGMTTSSTSGHKWDYKTGSDMKAYTADPALT